MKFKIIHTTTYQFSEDIFLEPHYLRFRPKQTAYIDRVDFAIAIQAKPEGHKIIEDEYKNVVDFCWFEGLTKKLTINAESIIETKPFNPFAFVLFPERFNVLPFEYNLQQKNSLLAELEAQPLSKDLAAFGQQILKEAQSNTITLLTTITRKLHEDFIVEYREEGPPLPPEQTFREKRGSCRDLSWMLIQLLRTQGIAARFVSGYYYFNMEEPSYELHAWVDVFLPGAGWLGLDPSHGILTGNTHFPIASSAYPEHTMPVSGAIRGDATSTLVTDLSIVQL